MKGYMCNEGNCTFNKTRNEYQRKEFDIMKTLNDIGDTKNQKCLALRDNFAVCGPAPDDVLSHLLIDRSEIENTINGTCYTAVHGYGGQSIEVCASSLKEAHLTMQEVGKDILSAVDPLIRQRH